MKKSKLLTLSVTLLMIGTLTACNNKKATSSAAVSSEEAVSSETVSYTDTLKDAADYIYQTYGKDYSGTAMTDSIQLPKKVVMNGGASTVTIEWSVKVTAGSQEAFAINDDASDSKYVTFYCGYYDGKVTEATTAELTATLTVDGHSSTLTELIGAAHGVITRTASVLVFNTYAEWAAATSGTAMNIKGVVVGVVATGSSSAGSFYLEDAEGHGYYAYKPATNKSGVNVGDEVIVSGTKTTYSGQDEFNSGCTYKNLGTVDQAVTYTDATKAWKEATAASTTAIGSAYQNTPVELKNCTPTRISGSYYYFKVDGGTTEYNIYDTYYFLSEEQRAQFKEYYNFALENNCTFDVKGVATVYSNNYQIYGIEDSASIVSFSDDATKAKYDSVAADFAGYKKLYPGSGSYDLPVAGTFGSTITWSLAEGTSAANFEIKDGKLVVTAPAAGEETATGSLVQTVTLGEATVTKTYSLAAKTLTEDDFVNGALDQVSELALFGGETLTLPLATGDYEETALTYAVKEGDTTGASITKGVLSVPNPSEATATVTLTVTATYGTKTASKDVTVKVTKVSTIAEFLAAKDTTNKQYVKGVVVAKNAAVGATGSYEISDGTNAVFSYNKTSAELGDEVIVETIYSVNNGVPQLTSDNVTVLSSKNTYTVTPTVQLTVDQIAEMVAAAASASTDDKNTMLATWGEDYGGKAIELTGYVVQSGSYYNMGASADATATPANMYSAGDAATAFKALVGKKVKAVVYYRGNNVSKGNMQFQLVSVTEVTE